jgi:hypothetical protein
MPLLHLLAFDHFVIRAPSLHQFLMAARLENPAVFQVADFVCVPYRGKSVSYQHNRDLMI